MGDGKKPGKETEAACSLPQAPDLSGVTQVALDPQPPVRDYVEALALAGTEAGRRLAHPMLLSWYDRDRGFADGIEARAARQGGRDCGFEAPQHVSECHQETAVPGYVDYALSRETTLRVDVENGRFVFFYRDAAV